MFQRIRSMVVGRETHLQLVKRIFVTSCQCSFVCFWIWPRGNSGEARGAINRFALEPGWCMGEALGWTLVPVLPNSFCVGWLSLAKLTTRWSKEAQYGVRFFSLARGHNAHIQFRNKIPTRSGFLGGATPFSRGGGHPDKHQAKIKHPANTKHQTKMR